jgi:hypothetical protein
VVAVASSGPQEFKHFLYFIVPRDLREFTRGDTSGS